MLTTTPAYNGCPGNSIPETLKHYGFPGGLFPNYVKHFTCEAADDSSSSDSLQMRIELYGSCNVSRELVVQNVVECEPEMSATISYSKLTNVKGVTSILYVFGLQFGPVMTVNEVVVSPSENTLQFKSSNGLDSPVFPLSFFPDQPPNCDDSPHLSNIHHQRFPSWASKYARLLPFVAA
ncbi:Type IV inositol polyphosphate 5-phosphatase 11 [Bienertia sinuspersici]